MAKLGPVLQAIDAKKNPKPDPLKVMGAELAGYMRTVAQQIVKESVSALEASHKAQIEALSEAVGQVQSGLKALETSISGAVSGIEIPEAKEADLSGVQAAISRLEAAVSAIPAPETADLSPVLGELGRILPEIGQIQPKVDVGEIKQQITMPRARFQVISGPDGMPVEVVAIPE